ncbi:MAG: alpha-L-fucosidase precursor [Draconibacterium sp.]|nr:alpha-L-fucosidase precursor [Draconibacterium sp.]
MERRNFIQKTGLGLSYAMIPTLFHSCKSHKVPSYLKDYSELYSNNPLEASKAWFKDSKFGLFITYGLFSLLERGEWVQWNEKIPVSEYEKLKDKFSAENFDADFLTDMALKAEMKYVLIVARYHDSFCIFDTKYSDFKSTNSPAKRDLVSELAESCEKKGLGLVLYYSHGRDWRHPHAPNNDGWGGRARPNYPTPDPHYAYGEEHDLQKYVTFMKNQITELLTNYGPIASIWLDGIGVPLNPKGKNTKEMFQCQELYDHIHSLQPQTLVSYKQGLTGTEDFLAPERHGKNQPGKLLEVCDTLQPYIWGYNKNDDGKHKTADEVMELLTKAQNSGANLLLNTGPLPDGSVYKEDLKTLIEVGQRLRQQ